MLQFSTRLRRDGLETDNFCRGKGVSLSVSAAVEKRWLGDRHFCFVLRGRGVSLSVSAAVEKRWLGDRQFFGGEEVCHCQSVQQFSS